MSPQHAHHLRLTAKRAQWWTRQFRNLGARASVCTITTRAYGVSVMIPGIDSGTRQIYSPTTDAECLYVAKKIEGITL